MKEPSPASSGLVIGLDAATPVSSVAVAAPSGRLLACLRRESRMPASRLMLDDLAHLLRDEDLAGAPVKAIGVTHGPGMFTGLRVGLALAKTLAHGWGAKLYGYSTLEIVARRLPAELLGANPVICVLLDARRGELYSGFYQAGVDAAGAGTRLTAVRPDAVEPLEAVLKALAENPWPAVILTGAGADLHRERLNQLLGTRARWAAPPWAGPGADALALAAAADYAAGRPGIDPLAAMPVYLRVSDAEKRHPVIS